MDAESDASRENPAIIKGKCNWAHAAKRASERYQIPGRLFADVGNAVKAYVAGDIPLFDVVELRPDHHFKNRSLFAVFVDQEWRAVVFDMATNTPVSMLPSEKLDSYRSFLEKRTPVSASPPVPKDGGQLLRDVYEAAVDEVKCGSYTRQLPKLTAVLSAVKRFFEGGLDADARPA